VVDVLPSETNNKLHLIIGHKSIPQLEEKLTCLHIFVSKLFKTNEMLLSKF